MVELASCSSIDWARSAVNPVKAKALKSKSLKANILPRESPVQLSPLVQVG